MAKKKKGTQKKKKKDRETCTEDSIEGERLIQQQAVGPHENRHCRRKEKKKKEAVHDSRRLRTLVSMLRTRHSEKTVSGLKKKKKSI